MLLKITGLMTNFMWHNSGIYEKYLNEVILLQDPHVTQTTNEGRYLTDNAMNLA